VKLRGRAEAPDGAEGAQFLSARGAKPQAHHGPLQRLLGALSHSDEVWDSNKRQAEHDEQSSVGNDIREDH
jgi:hypothetical protein